MATAPLRWHEKYEAFEDAHDAQYQTALYDVLAWLEEHGDDLGTGDAWKLGDKAEWLGSVKGVIDAIMLRQDAADDEEMALRDKHFKLFGEVIVEEGLPRADGLTDNASDKILATKLAKSRVDMANDILEYLQDSPIIPPEALAELTAAAEAMRGLYTQHFAGSPAAGQGR